MIDFKQIMEKIRNIVKIAEVTNPADSKGLDDIGQVDYLGKVTNIANVYPYGMSSIAPKFSNVLTLSNGGSSQNLIGIPYNTENRFRGMKEGEVTIGNFVTKCKIYFKEDGNIELKAGIDGGNIVLENKDGSASISIGDNGNIVLNGGTDSVVKGDTFKGEYDAHTHPTAFGPSGTAAPITPSSLNDTIKV